MASMGAKGENNQQSEQMGFFLLKGSFSFPPVLAHRRSLDRYGLLQNTVGSLAYCIKCLEATVVVIWRRINKPKLNRIKLKSLSSCFIRSGRMRLPSLHFQTDFHLIFASASPITGEYRAGLMQ